jgi:hypothetical protein
MVVGEVALINEDGAMTGVDAVSVVVVDWEPVVGLFSGAEVVTTVCVTIELENAAEMLNA